MSLYLCQRQLGGSWGIAILTILVDRRRSLWSSRLGERLHDCSLAYQDAVRQGAAAMRAAGFPQAQADGAAVALVHGRLVIQSVVNAFVDTFWYQAAVGALALFLVLFFGRARSLTSALRWMVAWVR